MVARPWSSSRLSCGERLLLICNGNPGNSFPTPQGKDPSSRARRRKQGSSGCGRDSRASSRVEPGMSGNFMSCSKGVKDPLEVPEVRCDLPGDASASHEEMGLISCGDMHLRFPPELQLQCRASLRVDQGICAFPSRLSHEAFPRALPRATLV